MTDQITVPKQTWDALREALRLAMQHTHESSTSGLRMLEALTAANAVSDVSLTNE